MFTSLENDLATRRQNVIFSSKYRLASTEVSLKNVVIIIYLYYEERINKYLKYIIQIPNQIKIVIISSKIDVIDCLKKELRFRPNVEFRHKENRGRDVSALLVASKDLIRGYRYFCFLHDKKEKIEAHKNYIEEWESLIWDNLICNEVYIQNILDYLYSHNDVGIIVPPLYLSADTTFEKGHNWRHGNKTNTEFLLERILNKKIQIDCNRESLSIGTVLWGKSEALTKLFDYDWSYEDFPIEPLSDDGTISHAIERCFPFVAADGGFTTISAMNDAYAAKRIETSDEVIMDFVQLIGDLKGIRTVNKIRSLAKQLNNLYESSKNKRVYIYGAGKYGRECLCLLLNKGIDPKAFIVTSKNNCDEKYLGYDVISLDQYQPKEEDLIIIALGEKNTKEVLDTLSSKCISNYVFYIKY